ncbi:MAG: efflux RND transporter permease subunit [Deltaproteobacteria bacterium]|nr:efflux RND transporter permease subunit [Deltaproteobacteria bacterium]MBW2444493.1 efflux RND transporter permease subunit [Deltaproteobacteria bacterium]
MTRFFIERRVVTLVLTAVMLLGGLQAYGRMARLEDPEFTIKDALVVTPYPGATAAQVEEEVTDALELAVQQLGQLDEIESRSERGLSTLTVTIKSQYDRASLPQVWDELRRKVGDAAGDLPPGAGPSRVIDDYGDVFGVFVAVYGPEYSYAELKHAVDLLRKELVLVEDVAKIETYGERVEAIYVELDRDRVSQLGLSPNAIIAELQAKNVISNAGRVKIGSEFVAIDPTGSLTAVAQFESILLSGGGSEQLYLRDVANIRRGYVDPQVPTLRYDGHEAIGLGISTVSGGNVVTMGEGISVRARELLSELPLGIEFGMISLQSAAVTQSISGFVWSLVQAVVIVVIVLLFFMGLRSGLLIGFVLILTIAGSFIFLDPMGVALERISLGALIIALGMLVDNAIVIVDGTLVRLQKGEDPTEATIAVVNQSGTPLLGATFIAILAFAVIGTSDDSTGEFCRSLFQVVTVSLLLSWVTAVAITPLLCVMFLKADPIPEGEDPYGGAFYQRYKAMLSACIRARWLTVGVVAAIFVISLQAFGFVSKSFFPSSTRPQFMVDLWLPQGTHIDDTVETVAQAEQALLALEGPTHVTSLVGQGGLRFLLTYTPEKKNSAYTQILVDVADATQIPGLIEQIETDFAERFPDALAYAYPFELGPGANGKIRARFSGPDANVLRHLGEQARQILTETGNAKAVRTDWRQRVKVLRPVLSPEPANLAAIQREQVAATVLQAFQGATVGVYRERDLLLPIILRAKERQRTNVESIRNLQIWSPLAKAYIPLRQVVSEFETAFEDEIVIRRDRKRTLTLYGDPVHGPATALFARVRPEIEALELPPGYALEWGGEYEDSANAQGPLFAAIPGFVALMILVTIGLFNSLKQPAIIWLTVPLALIGVTLGLLSTGQPFGFMALLGFLSLSGMLVKNAIVLIDEINLQRTTSPDLLTAITNSGTSRLRPVAMAASTTALGMIPLLSDAFFVSMAVTIIGGLLIATVLTMIFVPVLYAIFYRAD